jgi:lipoprotein-anchoring transpeptidase ErfK/SrfK
MLRSLVLALSCLVLIAPAAAQAEADKADPAPTSAASSSVMSPTTDDGRPHIAGAAGTVGEASEPAAAAKSEKPATDSNRAPQKPDVPDVAAKPAPPPEPTLTGRIDLAKQTLVVAENGKVKYSWPISSGAEEFPTPRGTFRPQWVAKMWYSRKYDNAPMPHSVFISGGVAIHATSHVRSLGRPASHGCIRLAPGNAKTFYNLVQRHGLKSTRVSIFGKPKWYAPAVASRNQERRRYAAAQDSGSWYNSSPRQYRAVSAYDPRFAQRRYRQVPRNTYYAAAPPRVYYRRPSNQRYVYVQRPQRRYYYNNSGYGW